MSLEFQETGAGSANKLLAALSAFSKRSKNTRSEALIVFLSVARNPGTGFKELVFVSGLGDSMVSRTVDALCQAEGGALLEIERPPTDGRRRLVHLSEAGRSLLAELDAILSVP